MAHVGVVEIVGTYHIGLIPDGIAFVIAIIVEVEIDFFLNWCVFKQRADAVKFGLTKQKRRRYGEKE
jgi:hypothetical protein